MEESLARKSLLGTVMNLLGAVVAYAGFFFIARLLPSTGLQVIGLIAFSTGYVSVFLPVSRLGFLTAHTKKVSEGSDLAECNGAFLLITLLLTSAMLVVTFASVFFWTFVLGRGFQSEQEIDAIWIMLGYTALTAISNVPVATFNARREIAKGQIGTFIGHIVRVGMIIVVVLAGFSNLDIIWAYFIGASASAAASFLYFIKYPLKWPGKGILGEYRRFASPLLVPSLISPLPVSLAPVLVQFFGNLAYTGYFGSAYRIVIVFAAIGISVTNVIFPKLSELHSQGMSVEIRSRTRASEKLLAFVLAPVSLFVVVYASGVIHVLLSNDFLPAVPAMAALSLYVYINGVSSSKVSLLPALNRPALYGKISAVSSIIMLVLMFLLIPVGSPMLPLPGLRDLGAAIALLGGAVFTYAAVNHYSNSIAGTTFEYRLALYPAISLIACLILLPLAAYFPPVSWTWYLGLMFIAASVLIYIGISLVTRLATIEDLRVLLDSVNPFAMHKYVRSELSTRFSNEDGEGPPKRE